MTTGPKKVENRGGKRPGAGRPKGSVTQRSFSAEKIQELNDRIDARAKKEKKHIDDVALDIIYDKKQGATARMTAYKALKEYSTIKAGEGGAADQALSPQVYLPENRPDPSLTVVDGGKSVDSA